MTKITKEIADHLHFQANHLYDQASEFPEYKARNEAAAKEVEELETLFLNDDIDENLTNDLRTALGDFDATSLATEGYRGLLEDIGFNSHYETPEDFLLAVLAQIKPTSA